VSVFNFKGEGQIGASVEQVLEYFRSMPISDWILLENSVNQENTRKCTYSVLPANYRTKLRAVEKIDEDKDDWIMRVKFPFPFQDRDVVFQRVIGTKSSHEGYLVCYSIDRPDVQSPKGVVRANMSTYYYVCVTYHQVANFSQHSASPCVRLLSNRSEVH
jgi:hypothetical protein